MIAFISKLVLGLLPSLILGWLLDDVKGKARVEGDKQWLEYNWRQRGFATVLAALFLATSVLYQIEKSPGESIFPAVCILIFGGLVASLALEFFFVRIAFDSANVYCFSGWRRSRVVPWSAVKSCSFSPAAQWWILETEGHGRIRIHKYLSGLDSFFKELKARTKVRYRPEISAE